MSEPFHIVHCLRCEGRGYEETLMVGEDGEPHEVAVPCPECDSTGHRVLPFKFEVILEAEGVVPRREVEPDDGVSQG